MITVWTTSSTDLGTVAVLRRHIGSGAETTCARLSTARPRTRSVADGDQQPRQSFEGDPADGEPGGRTPQVKDADRTAATHEAVAHQVATDTYQALPNAERIAVAAGVVTRLGNLWFGPQHGADEAVTHRVYSGQLRASLAERGHLADTTGDPSTRNSDPTQVAAIPRPARRPGARPSRDRPPQQPRSPSTRPVVTEESQKQPAPHPLMGPPQHVDPARQPKPRL
jgi:hypothetical protein